MDNQSEVRFPFQIYFSIKRCIVLISFREFVPLCMEDLEQSCSVIVSLLANYCLSIRSNYKVFIRSE